MVDFFHENMTNKKMTYINNRKIKIRMYRQIRLVNVEAIVYCRSQERFTNIAILDENKELSTRHSLKEMKALLSEGFFIHCHRCFLVNMQHVKAYNLGCHELILINDVNIKVSNLKVKLIMQYFEKHT